MKYSVLIISQHWSTIRDIMSGSVVEPSEHLLITPFCSLHTVTVTQGDSLQHLNLWLQLMQLLDQWPSDSNIYFFLVVLIL